MVVGMTKGWKIFWIVFDMIFFGIYFLYFAVLLDPWQTILYYDGLNETQNGFYLFMFPLIYAYISVPYIALLILRLTFCRKYFNSGNHKTWISRRVMLSAMFLWVAGLFISAFVHEGNSFLRGFEQRIRQRLDVAAVRAWMDTLENNSYDGVMYALMVDKNLPFEVPKEIESFSKQVHYLKLWKEDDHRYCEIVLGGGFMHWGIVIGPEEMKVDADSWRRLKVEDGVYVWSD